jgi:RHS repeat-associated protein
MIDKQFMIGKRNRSREVKASRNPCQTGNGSIYYYYLRDHLGNHRIVMDASGTVVQVNNYYPSGATMADYPRRTDQGIQPYKFGGKELDRSNGLDFYDFEARSFDPALMRFTMMDPLAEKYYNISPYVYCLNNPVKYVDLDGRKVYFAPGVSQEFKNQFATSVQYLNEKGAAGMLAKLHSSEATYYIAEVRNGASFDPGRKTISWDPNVGLLTNEGIVISPTSVLNHEIDHALQYDTNKNQYISDIRTSSGDNYNNLEEKRVITGSEQTTARKLGEIGQGEVTRTDHGGTLYETKGVKSTEGKNEIIITPNNNMQNENTWNFFDWNNFNQNTWNPFMQW